MQILNVAASSSGSTQLDHIPQLLGVNLGAAGTVSKLIVTSLKRGVILDLSSEQQIKDVAQSMSFDVLGASEILLLPLAAGFTEDENINVSIVTGAGNNVTVHDISLVGNPARVVYNTLVIGINANAQASFEKFLKLIPESPNAADTITITSSDMDMSNTLTVAELVAITGLQSNQSSGGVVAIRNNEQTVKRVQYAPTSTRNIVLQRIMVDGSTDMKTLVKGMADNLAKKVGTGEEAKKGLILAGKNLIQAKNLIK